MNEAEVLRKAADLIEKDGWCQGAYFNGGKSCVHGALYHVTRSSAQAYGEAKRALETFLGVDPLAAIAWNDGPEMTAELVVKTMRAAADALEDVHA